MLISSRLFFCGLGPVLAISLGSRLFLLLGFSGLIAILRELLFLELGRFGKHQVEMRGDGFAFAVRVARQVHGVRGTGGFAEVINQFALAGMDLEGWVEDLA